MLELTEQNAAEILHARGHLADSHTAKVRELSGGVSNAVFLVEQGAERFVVKQARGKLRVQADWQCSVERIWREVEVLKAYGDLMQPVSLPFLHIPALKWKDQELYAYAMTAAPANFSTWKDELMAGRIAATTPQRAGTLLNILHWKSWHHTEVAERFDDRQYFADLRLEPYYRVAAERYLPLAKPLKLLIDETWEERHCLVHGDFSPKNLLVYGGHAFLIDFEVGHYGDPAFDIGFFLTHLTLKGIHFPQLATSYCKAIHEFIGAYNVLSKLIGNDEMIRLLGRSTRHLAGCLVARVHGKSPVDYLTPAEQLRAVNLSEQLFALGTTASWPEAYQLLQRELKITPS
jgi:5-methylthioribose kinase